jgi:hypothetical protein
MKPFDGLPGAPAIEFFEFGADDQTRVPSFGCNLIREVFTEGRLYRGGTRRGGED